MSVADFYHLGEMYSGSTITNHSGNWLGVHQKIDRAALRALSTHTSVDNFPPIKQLLYFEGRNGPDGIKNKSPAQDEPWHYYDPFDPDDTELVNLIKKHHRGLVDSLKAKDLEKAAFEAAWMAHALVDGLTPAHHYPYEEELEVLRGEDKASRTTLKEKLIIKGETKRDTLKKNWKMWGAKGLMSTHGLFEAGVALTLAPNKITLGNPSKAELKRAVEIGIEEYFMQTAREIAMLDMYDRFYRRGWTTKLARETRNKLAPKITKVVVAGWYQALHEAGMTGKPKVKK